MTHKELASNFKLNEIIGTEGRDTLYGNAGDDIIYGEFWTIDDDPYNWKDAGKDGAMDDLIYSGNGDDSVFGHFGNDTAYLGKGDDWYGDFAMVSDGTYMLAYNLFPGTDRVHGAAGNDMILARFAFGGSGNDDLRDIAQPDVTLRGKLVGGAGNDRIEGSFNCLIDGGAGNDRIYVNYTGVFATGEYFGGNHYEIGISGDNLVYGGAGKDAIYRVASGGNEIWTGKGADDVFERPLNLPDNELPESLGGDRFCFSKGDVRGDFIEGFVRGSDKIDLSHYDLDRDGVGDLNRRDIEIVRFKGEPDSQVVYVNGEMMNIHTTGGHMTVSDFLF